MEITTKTIGDVTVAELHGDLDGKTAPKAQDELLPLVKNLKVIFDMSDVYYMSSAGLRMLLSIRRQIPVDGRLILCGLSEQLQDTMNITGFIDFYTICGSQAEALKMLQEVVR